MTRVFSVKDLEILAAVDVLEGMHCHDYVDDRYEATYRILTALHVFDGEHEHDWRLAHQSIEDEPSSKDDIYWYERCVRCGGTRPRP